MKNVLIDMLKEKGFTELPVEDELLQHCNGLILQREIQKDIEAAFYGVRTVSFAVRVFVNRDSGICNVSYQQGGREYKNRWYSTIGKRTYNAIVETTRCAGFEF